MLQVGLDKTSCGRGSVTDLTESLRVKYLEGMVVDLFIGKLATYGEKSKITIKSFLQ
jgi:hypothetical protein